MPKTGSYGVNKQGAKQGSKHGVKSRSSVKRVSTRMDFAKNGQKGARTGFNPRKGAR